MVSAFRVVSGQFKYGLWDRPYSFCLFFLTLMNGFRNLHHLCHVKWRLESEDYNRVNIWPPCYGPFWKVFKKKKPGMRSNLKDTGSLRALIAELFSCYLSIYLLQWVMIIPNLWPRRLGCIDSHALLIIVIEHSCTCIKNLTKCMIVCLCFCRVLPIWTLILLDFGALVLVMIEHIENLTRCMFYLHFHRVLPIWTLI